MWLLSKLILSTPLRKQNLTKSNTIKSKQKEYTTYLTKHAHKIYFLVQT